MSETEIQRWTREVAQDPGASSFVRLARAYRRLGRREAAREVVIRGLERNPEHLDAHSLLALIHVEAGEHERAADEWQTVLRLDPNSFDASRGLGFLALERGDLEGARHHLDAAARIRPDDPTVAQALQVLEARASAPAPPAPPAPPAARAASAPPATDPSNVFSSLAAETPFLGAIVLDEQGLVLAGSLTGDGRRAELLGALLDTVVDEAGRAARLTRLGDWNGVLLDCDEAMLHIGPLPRGGVVVVAARTGTPAGWMVRTARRAHELAVGFVGAAS